MKLLSILLLFLVLTGPLLLSACADPNDQYIQGTWDRSDIHILDYWVYDRGTYLHKSGVQLSNPNLHPVDSLTCQRPFAYPCPLIPHAPKNLTPLGAAPVPDDHFSDYPAFWSSGTTGLPSLPSPVP